jgi:hypothetical protein
VAFKTTAGRVIPIILILVLMLAWSPAAVASEGEGQPSDQIQSAAPPTLATIKAALPPAPSGWTIRDETKIDVAPGTNRGRQAAPAIRYQIRYRRIVGVRDEQRKLDEVFAESSRRNQEAAKPQIDELIRQQTAVSLALKKAERRRNEAEQKRLNDELVENGRKMSSLHEEIDRTISREVEPYLVKNAEALIEVGINVVAAEIPQEGKAFEYRRAAVALQTDGERAGMTEWKEGMLLILFGDWQRVETTRFRGTVRPDLPQGRAQTISLSITGEQKLAEQLLKAMDVKSILKLMDED